MVTKILGHSSSDIFPDDKPMHGKAYFSLENMVPAQEVIQIFF